MRLSAALPALVLACAPLGAAGQGLGARITGGGDGVVRMSFPARPGVQICRDGFDLGGRRSRRFSGARDADGCAPGPVVVEVRVSGGEVRRVEVLDLDHPRAPQARDLGTVGAQEAAVFLVRCAREGAGGRGVEGAILPVMMADVPEAWKQILDLAGDAGVDSGVRRTALFWVGQEAAEAATEGLAAVARDEGEEQDVRDAAVFALSQRPADEGVPVLMELARTAREPKTRRTAFFWLAQSGDARVIPFFREVLLGRREG